MFDTALTLIGFVSTGEVFCRFIKNDGSKKRPAWEHDGLEGKRVSTVSLEPLESSDEQ